MTKYHCEHHKLEVLCAPCMIAIYNKYQELLVFVKRIVSDWECDPNNAESLLEKIGEDE